jgi:hypothetical protein
MLQRPPELRISLVVALTGFSTPVLLDTGLTVVSPA